MRVRPEELAFAYKRVLTKALNGLGKSPALSIVDDVVMDLVDATPASAFELFDPGDAGFIFYHQDVNDTSAADLNWLLMSAHLGFRQKPNSINVILSSYGGTVVDGLTVISTIQRIQREGRAVNVHVPGYAMSCGSLILQAGTHRSMDANGWLMVHNMNWNQGHGTLEEHRDFLAQAEREMEQLCSIYESRSGIEAAEWRKMMHKTDLYLNAEEALTLGLVDEVVRPPQYAKPVGVLPEPPPSKEQKRSRQPRNARHASAPLRP